MGPSPSGAAAWLLPGLLGRSIYVINKIWDCELAHNSALRAVVTTAHGNLGLNRLNRNGRVMTDFCEYIYCKGEFSQPLIIY